jgi:hypothetical protein
MSPITYVNIVLKAKEFWSRKRRLNGTDFITIDVGWKSRRERTNGEKESDSEVPVNRYIRCRAELMLLRERPYLTRPR